MFVGHEFLAFALVAALARVPGHDPARALSLGAVGAVAALLPDLDLAYALARYAATALDGSALSWEAFWRASSGVHRVVTHSLPVAAVATLAFAATAALGRRRAMGGGPHLAARSWASASSARSRGSGDGGTTPRARSYWWRSWAPLRSSVRGPATRPAIRFPRSSPPRVSAS